MEIHQDDVENVVENVEDDVVNAEVCDGNDVECDEGADNVIENEDCVENDLEAGEDGFTVGDNGRVTSNQRTAEIVEGSINDQTAHVQQENVVSNSLKVMKHPKQTYILNSGWFDRVNGRKHECCQSSPNELENIKIGSTFFKKEMKSPAVWTGSKSVIGKRLYVQRVCC